jgi:hypothetical protein
MLSIFYFIPYCYYVNYVHTKLCIPTPIIDSSHYFNSDERKLIFKHNNNIIIIVTVACLCPTTRMKVWPQSSSSVATVTGRVPQILWFFRIFFGTSARNDRATVGCCCLLQGFWHRDPYII